MSRPAAWAAAAVFVVAVAQLAVGAFAGLDQFEGKAFGARLGFYPAMMLVAPAAWWLLRGRRGGAADPPWAAFALIMAPFLIDVTGNTLDLYDRVWWWDDANHFANWLLLCLGIGLLLARGWRHTGAALALTVAGVGALLAIGWEIAEWWAFIRHGTERTTAYEDTLGDEALGTLGGTVAGAALWWRHTRRGDSGQSGE
ncbi:MAG: hypothetical protein KDC33_11140 [Thermoleophilia bacterium]|nr:hypothetical protein [Thermoleophilia bacterium]